MLNPEISAAYSLIIVSSIFLDVRPLGQLILLITIANH